MLDIDMQTFMRTFRKIESVVEQYNRDFVEWERQTSRNQKPQTGKIASTPTTIPQGSFPVLQNLMRLLLRFVLKVRKPRILEETF